MVNTIRHLSYLLNASEQNLRTIIDNIEAFYYEGQQPKMKYGEVQCDEQGNVRLRDLCVSRFPLKIIQQRINKLLQQIELPSYAYGSVKNKSNILNAKQHISGKFFFTVDMKDFFPNINQHQVFQMFRQNNFSPTVARVLTQLTTYKGQLPQGIPTSPLISNLVFVKTGLKLAEVINDQSITFTTYLDDLTFSSRKDFRSLTPVLTDIIKSDGFYINRKKIAYKTFRSEVTGIIIYKNRLWPIRAMVEKANDNLNIAAYIKSIQKMSGSKYIQP